MTASSALHAPDATQLEPPAPGGTTLAGRLGVIALIATAPASLLILSFARGGYFPDSTGLAAIGFAAALVLRTTLAEYPFEGYNRRVALVLLSLAGFALWQLTSALWSHDLARALDQYDRTLLYVLAFALFASLPRTSARARWLLRSLAASMTAVALAALISRVLPHLWPTAATFYASRLSYPLTYWNADGLMCALATIFLVHLAATHEEAPAVRVLAAIFVPATATATLLTFSRAALGIGAICLVVYLILARPRGLLGAAVSLVPTSAVALHAGYAAVLLASDTPTSRAAVAQGRHVAITVGGCMLGAGVLRALMLRPDRLVARSVERLWAGRRISRRTIVAACGATAAVALVALAASGLLARGWHQFASAHDANPKVTRDRLTALSGEKRTLVWRVALHAFESRPLAGYGAGTFELYYYAHRPIPGVLTDAHELYLQTLAELGIVGFCALGLAIFGILILVARRIRGPDAGTFAALFSAILAWVLTAALDWDWQLTAVTLWVFIAGAASLASPAGAGARILPRNRTAMAVGWLVLAVAPLLVGVSYTRLRASSEQMLAGDCVKARQSALSAISLLPARPEAYEIIDFCDLQMGFPVEALQAARKAVHYGPNNWNYQYGLALALAANGEDPRPAAARALALDPREDLIKEETAAFSGTGPTGWEQAEPSLLIGALQTGRLSISNL